MSLSLAHTTVSNQRLAGGPPLLILHGLFGMARNWRSVAKALARSHSPVVCADLRNHGDSPHHPSMSIDSMVGDVHNLIEQKLGPGPVHLMGHSLGGKVAMLMALQHPQLVQSLIIVDSTPQPGIESNRVWFRSLMQRLQSLDLRKPPMPETLSAAKLACANILKADVPEKAIREFLLTNLAEDADNPDAFRWRINLPALLAHVDEMFSFELNSSKLVYNGPTIFIGGSKSAYISPKDSTIPRLFPRSRITFVEGAGHWVHADKPAEFCTQVTAFLTSLASEEQREV